MGGGEFVPLGTPWLGVEYPPPPPLPHPSSPPPPSSLPHPSSPPPPFALQTFLPLAFEGSFSGETFHYEDDGDTQGYLDGLYQWTRASYVLTDDSVTFTVR